MKAFKKFMKRAAACGMSLLTFGLVACGDEPTPPSGGDNTPKHIHSYTETVVDDLFLESEATCTEPARYYYSCACEDNAIGNNTFTDGEALGHTGDTGEDDEYKVCEECGEAYEKKGGSTGGSEDVGPTEHVHSFTAQVQSNEYLKTAATCTEAAVYYYKCYDCAEAGTNTYSFGDPEGHIQRTPATTTSKAVCDVCEEEYGDFLVDPNAHICSFTREVFDGAYKASEATCTEAARYYYVCVQCAEHGTATYAVGEANGHKGGTIDEHGYANCEECGNLYVPETEHVCSFTRMISTSEFLASAATCGEAAKYYYSCKCGEKSTETFSYGLPTGQHTGGTATTESGPICDVCGQEYGEALHQHTFTREVRNSYYLASAATCGEPAKYYYACTDTSCTEKSTTTYNVGSPTGNHTGGTATTESGPICDVCHKEYGSPLANDNQGDPNAAYTLKIKVYNAGYGTGWIDSAIDNFKAKYPNSNITIESSSNMFNTLSSEIDGGTCDADIALIQSSDYHKFAGAGKLVKLDGMLAGKVPGENQTVKSMIPQSQLDYYSVDGSQYGTPWQDNFTNGIVYNKTFFATHGLSVPTTMDEYFALCEQILALSINTNSSTADDVAPLVYAGGANGYALNIPNQWVTEYYGYNYMQNTFMQYNSYTILNDTETGRQKAYDTFARMFNGQNAAGKSYVLSGSNAMSSTQAQQKVLAAKPAAAMYVCGSWIYTEEDTKLVSGALANYLDFGFFGLPHINADKKDAFGNDSSNVRYSLGANSLTIPATSQNQEAAKLFLAELYTQENLLAFIEGNSGVGRPLTKYIDISSLGTSTKRLAFTQQAYEYYYGTSAKRTQVVYQTQLSPISRFINPASYGGELGDGSKEDIVLATFGAVNYAAAQAAVSGAAARESAYLTREHWDYDSNYWKTSSLT